MQHDFKFYHSPSGPIEGQGFEIAMTARIALNLALNEDIVNFELSSNVPKTGKFNDIIVSVLGQNTSQQKYRIQLKYKSKKNLTAIGLQDHLNEHFADYIRLPDEVDFQPLIIYKTSTSFGSKTFLINNKSIAAKAVKTPQVLELVTNLENIQCYKFALVETNLKLDTKLQNFLNNYRVITTTSTVLEIEESVKNDIVTNFLIDRERSTFFADFIRKWYLQSKKIVLFKTFLLEVIALYVLNILVPKQSSKEPLSDKEKQFLKCINKFKITIFGQKRESEVVQFAKKFLLPMKLDHQQHLLDIYQLNNFDENKKKAIISWLLSQLPLIVQNTTNKIIEMLSSSKQFILLTDNNVPMYKYAFFNLINLQETDNKLYNEVLKSFNCQLQGKRLTLKSLMDINEKFHKLITTNELILMLNDSFCIGTMEQLPSIYIPRNLSKHIFDTKIFKLSNKDTKLVVTNAGRSDCITQFTNPYVITEETSCADKKYTQQINYGNEVHNFEALEHQQFEWIKSTGSVAKVQSCGTVPHSLLPEELANIYEEKTNLHLICGMAGTGKTTLMKRIANKTSAQYWTIFLDVRHHSLQFQQQKHKDWKRYICDLQKQHLSPYDFEIFCMFFEAKQVRWIWDGLDELFDDCCKILCGLITELSKDGSQHWLTSRDNLKNELEGRFNVISRCILPMEEEQQKQFVQTRLGLSGEETVVIFDLIVNNKALYSVKNIVGVPLCLQILTELLDKDQGNYVEKLREGDLTIADICEYFVDEKFRTYFTKKGVDLSRNLNFKNERLETYRRLSLHLYFSTEQIAALNLNADTDLKEQMDEVGLVQSMSKDSRPQFIHNSLGEYFVASLLAENWQRNKAISAFFFDEQFNNIRFFHDLLISRCHKAHRAVLYQNWDVLDQCSDQELQEIDCRDRSALHLISSWGKKFILKQQRYKDVSFEDEQSAIHQETFREMRETDSYIKSFETLAQKCKPSKPEAIFSLDPISLAIRSRSLLSCGILIGRSPDLHKTLHSTEIYNEVIRCCLFHDYAAFFTKALIMPKNLEYTAVQFLALNCIKTIIERFDVRRLLPNGDSLLHLCYKVPQYNYTVSGTNHQSSCTQVTELLLKYGADVNARNRSRETPIFNACRRCYKELVEFLLDKGADVHKINDNGETPLFIACRHRDKGIAELLLQNGADVNMVNSNQETPLAIACKYCYTEIAELLLENGADIDIVDRYENTPLFTACHYGDEDLVKLLLKKGADMHRVNYEKETPLFYACCNDNNTVAKLLLDNGADVNLTNNQDETPLCFACSRCDKELVKILLENGADVNQVNMDGETPLFLACTRGDKEICELLLKNGAAVNIVNYEDVTPLSFACMHSYNREFVKLLLENGADVNMMLVNKETPFFIACEHSEKEIVELLLEKDINVNMVNNVEETPLFYACRNYDKTVAKLLLDKGADANMVNVKKETPLFTACERSDTEVVELLLNEGADINAINAKQETPLFKACRSYNNKLLILLLRKGANVHKVNVNNETPLFVACEYGNKDLVKLLLEKGADFNTVNASNETPLFIACKHNNEEIVEFLLEKKATVSIVNCRNETALFTARKHNFNGVVELLTRYGAK